MTQGESVILCEGYHDRAFWDGWLKHLGCQSPGPGKIVLDPWGKRVVGGQFGYQSKGGNFVRLIPCQGDDFVLTELAARLKGRNTNALRRVAVTFDADDAVSGTVPAAIASLQQRVEAVLKVQDAGVKRSPTGDFEMDAGALPISLVVWWATDAHAPGVPLKQTLERLTCSAICAAYPTRSGAVETWLGQRGTDAPAADHKAYAWSFMAGWYSERGCEAFYSRLWEDPLIAKELEQRLKAAGAWRVAEELAQ